MRNAIKINPTITLGTVPNSEDLLQLKDIGYKTVVDVREEEEKFGGKVEQRARKMELQYISIPIRRTQIRIDDVLSFYRVVFDESMWPIYTFSRFGKKPMAFLALFDAVINDKPMATVLQRASKLGMDLRGDLCLQSFLVNFFNSGDWAKLKKEVADYHSTVFGDKNDEGVRDRRERHEPHSPAMSGVHRDDRQRILGQQGCTIWLTGLPSSGKTTIAYTLERELFRRGYIAYVMDSKNARSGLNSDLDYTPDDRSENARRIGYVAEFFADAGLIAISSLISPYRKDRAAIAEKHNSSGLGFVEVFVDAPLQYCEQQDSRGLYARAKEGKLPEFTGVDAVYEEPESPDVVVKPAESSLQEIVEQIIDVLTSRVWK